MNFTPSSSDTTSPDTPSSGVPVHTVPAPVTVTATAAPAHTPTALPPVPSSAPASDTEDSDDDSVMLAVTSAPSGRATAIAVNDRSAPQLTAGIHTLEAVTDYIRLCRNFFVNKQVAPKEQVRRIAHQIADPMFANWVNANATTVYAMTFDSFSTEIYNRLLGRRWAAKQANAVRRLRQGTGTFDAFKNAVLSGNALLISSSHALSEDALQATLRAGLCAALRVEVDHAELDPAMSFDDWLDELERLDQQRLAKAETLDPLITQLVNQRLRDLGLSTSTAHKSSRGLSRSAKPTPAASADAPTPMDPHPRQTPRLTDEEHDRLRHADGCFKCRRFYAGHRSNSCNIPVSDRFLGKITEAATLAAIASHATPVAPSVNAVNAIDTAGRPRWGLRWEDLCP
ncbi:hypothetical protein K488DRAFT_82876 [Vararia minispora EC-137]|uniref:Uncharacterized protein n=1 Tax=Vararia minispora EC-137 TaxID=1314806 RepID=A0ACB8QV55_9AGAM|nr:hypothetical protein K488DRAFT_82876 [Vararia minispora EC-137]